MGTLRLYLAICVAVTHYAASWRPSWIAFSMLAVPLFYLVSGFYMSLILAEKYQRRTGAFFLNRALRLYPPYFVALAIMVVMTNYGLIPQQVHYFDGGHPLWIFNQLTVFPAVLWRNLSLNMEAGGYGIMMGQFYTVGLEMIFYALAPLLALLRTRWLLLMLPFAIALHFAPEYLGLDRRAWQYDFFPSLFVFFLMGCLSHRLYAAVKALNFPRQWGYAVLPIFLLLVLNDSGADWTNALAPWLIYAAITVGIPFLFLASKTSAADEMLGNVAYPLYLVHNLAIWLGQSTAAKDTAYEWIVVASLMATMSFGLWFLVDRPVDWFRAKIAAGRVTLPRMVRRASPAHAAAAPGSDA